MLAGAAAVEAVSYESRVAQEIENYRRHFSGRLSQDVPSAWHRVEQQFARTMERATGHPDLYAYVAAHVAGRSSVDVLGLGSGACGNELDGIAPLLKNRGVRMRLTGLDINEEILAQAKAEAEKRDVPFTALVQDANALLLEESSFDVIVAYAALHHFVDLDRVAAQIHRALRPDGVFVTVDVPTPNGFRMRPETRAVVRNLWAALPPQFKVDHTRYAEPRFAEEYEDLDLSRTSFECINSEAILPALRARLEEVAFVPAHSLARRFFDTKFGPNFDLSRPLDESIVSFILELDRYYLETGKLEPETFFGAYVRK